MSGQRPRLVVTLIARSLDDARAEVQEALAGGSDLAEIRVDRWPAAERARLDGLFPSPLPLIATLRSRAEGGEGPDDPTERARILAGIARLPFAWIDLEPARDEIDRTIHGAAHSVILSTHFPAGTPPSPVLRSLEAPVPMGAIRKVVVPAEMRTALTELIPFLQRSRPRSDRVVLTTGGSGPLLRGLAKRLDLPLVYAAPPETPGASRSIEPAQVPVDRLRRFFGGPKDAPLFALLGRPVAHSLSPAIQDRWLVASGRIGLYVPLEIESEPELRTALGRMGELGFRGVNVTHPWKAAALAVARRCSSAAEECGAANCLTLGPAGWEADNTDCAAIERRLRELQGAGAWDGDRLTVLGAGGAARATLVAARRMNAHATVYTRRPSAATEVVRAYGGEVGDPGRPAPDRLVVQASSAGMEGPLEVPLARLLTATSTVLDWVYRPTDASVGEATRRAGARYESGERLLVYQAAASFDHWWGEPPSPAAEQAVLVEVGCAV
jgi:shikimate dehydrogenase/3-dehydroquinate dehydratase type I